MECEKRQRVVKRGNGGQVESFRCLNNECDMHGQTVDLEQCSRCPLAVVFKKRPCNKIPAPCEECREKERQYAKTHDKVDVPEYPALVAQLVSWKEAVRKWRAAGKPTRTDEEVAEIKNKFCNRVNCDWFDPEKNRCRGCGCKVTNGGVAVLNKIRMATEHCPRGLW